MHAHGRGQAKAHGAKATGIDPTSGLVKMIILGSEHLMLAHIRGNKGIALSHSVQGLYSELRQNTLTRCRLQIVV